MIKYRPHSGSLEESMANAKEFRSLSDMYDYIVSTWNNSNTQLFSKEDLCVGEDFGTDRRIGWKETRYVCVKRMGSKIYEHAQCIGVCSIE